MAAGSTGKTKLRVDHEDGKITVSTGGGATSEEYTVKNGLIDVDPADVNTLVRAGVGTVVDTEPAKAAPSGE